MKTIRHKPYKPTPEKSRLVHSVTDQICYSRIQKDLHDSMLNRRHERQVGY